VLLSFVACHSVILIKYSNILCIQIVQFFVVVNAEK